MATYRKTAKGLVEVSTRANRLSPKHRAALILVDGRKSHAELTSMLAVEAEDTLRWLSDTGFIEADGNAANTSPWVASIPGSQAGEEVRTTPREAPPASRKPIAQIQRESVRELTELVGPMGEALALKIERSRSREELKSLLDIAFQVLSNTRGNPVAEAFRAKHIDGL